MPKINRIDKQTLLALHISNWCLCTNEQTNKYFTLEHSRCHWLARKKMPINEIRSKSNQIGIQINYKTIFNEHLINVILFGFYVWSRPFTTNDDWHFLSIRIDDCLLWISTSSSWPNKAASLHGWTWMSWSQSNYCSTHSSISVIYLQQQQLLRRNTKDKEKNTPQQHIANWRIKTLRFSNLIRFSSSSNDVPFNPLRFG